MARRTFISYKYSEAQTLRDEILSALGDHASYYTGETADSPDLTDTSVENIKKNLCDMMYNTSVTIVIISPNMLQSKWIDWELEYCLKNITREGRTSTTNGIVGVIQKVDGSYDWLVEMVEKTDGCRVRNYKSHLLYSIIKENRYNLKKKKYTCDVCKSVSQLDASYISLIDEEEFLNDPEKFIENAFNKSENEEIFDLTRQR